jgi:ABC-type antimicrobial peptide transport system ATPase subunit
MYRLFAFCVILVSCNSPIKNIEKISDEPISQNTALTKKAAQEFMKKLDSVVLVQHISYYNPPLDPKTGKLSNISSLLKNNVLNNAVVIKSAKLNEADIEWLSKTLDINVNDDISYTKCFEPHNSIIGHKGKNIYYIDFCFDCLGYFEKEFPFDTTMSYAKYKKIENFFLRKGLGK